MRQSAIAIFLAAFFLSGAFPTGAYAASTGLSIQPIKISTEIKAGTSVSGEILLSNASDEDVQVDVTVQDFLPDAGTDSIKFVGRAPGLTTVRDWITIGGNQAFVFKKGESKKVPYTITAPANAEPGSHFGVAFFKATRLADAEAGLKVGTQVGMLVFVTVPGNYKQTGRIVDFTSQKFYNASPVDFYLTFENTGTVHFVPQGSIVIKNMFGKTVGTVPIDGQVVLPTGIKKMHLAWQTSDILMGRYTASATVYDGEKNILTTKDLAFWAFPLWYLMWFGVSIVVLFLIFSFLRRRLRFSVTLK
jgi:hypothetical protein